MIIELTHEGAASLRTFASKINSTVDAISDSTEALLKMYNFYSDDLGEHSDTFEDMFNDMLKYKKRTAEALEYLIPKLLTTADLIDEYIANSPTLSVGCDVSMSTSASGTTSAGGNGSAASAAGGNYYSAATVYEKDITVRSNENDVPVHICRKVHLYNAGIDLNLVRNDGLTNLQAMRQGNAPHVIRNGVECVLDLHHLTQEETIHRPNSQYLQGTLVEIPTEIHQRYTKTLHTQYKRESGIRRSFRVTKMPNHKYVKSFDDKQFQKFKEHYWMDRASELTNSVI